MDSFTKPPPEAVKFSEEPGFVSFDMFEHVDRLPPPNTPGILAFLQVDEYSEMVLRIRLVEDLAECFKDGRMFCEHANVASYLAFSRAEDGHEDLLERLRLYARLTEKYDAPQTIWPVNDYFSRLPIPE